MTGKVKLALAGMLLACGTWFFFTPYIAFAAMRSAAEARDAPKLASYVNFPALKESLKASFNAKLAADTAKKSEANPFAVLGAALASAFLDKMIDALVTPENLAMMMKGEPPQPRREGGAASKPASDVNTSMSYESFDRFVVAVRKKGEVGDPMGLVFNREGMFGWKLSAIRLPG